MRERGGPISRVSRNIGKSYRSAREHDPLFGPFGTDKKKRPTELVEFLYLAAVVWGSICVISFFAFMAIYLHSEFTQKRRDRAAVTRTAVDAPTGARLV